MSALGSFTTDEFQEHAGECDGICTACAAIRYGNTEPDARDYPCEDCGQNKVIGFEEALVSDLIIVQ